MRFTRKVFYDLAIWMVFFGLGIGVTFPFFVMILGVPEAIAQRASFFGACLGAGALAGIINFVLARVVVGHRIRLLAGRMNHVGENIRDMTYSGDLSLCTPENCEIAVDSEDELGDSARSFNHLVYALAGSMKTQAAVRSFSEMLSSQLEIAGLAQNALNQFFGYTGAQGGLIVYKSEGELKVAASRGMKAPEKVAASEHVAEVVRTGEAQSLTVPAEVLVEGVVTEFRPREVMLLPIVYKSVPLGAVILAKGSAFEVDHKAQMSLFMPGLGLGLNNAMIYDDLQNLVALDPLTGVYNRRFGLKRLHEEFGRAVRAGTALGVLMIDVDHFKVVNDSYGHLVGDRLIKAICAIARSTIREGDILMRYGGEEFLAVLPAASAADIQRVGERLRLAVEQHSLQDGENSIRVTLSAGGAAFPHIGVTTETDLVRLSDEAMYRAKQTGRNRVEMAPEVRAA